MLETSRLLLRKPITEDFPRFWTMMTDPVAKQYTGGITQLTYVERLELFEEECTSNYTPKGVEFAVVEKNSGLYIGYCGFRYSETLCANEFLFGYCQDSWGKGYATEAAKSVLQYLFSVYPYDYYFSTVHPKNIASQKVLVKIGFHIADSVRIHKDETDILFHCHKPHQI